METLRLVLEPLSVARIHSVLESKTQEEVQAELGCDEAGYERYKQMHELGMETFRISQQQILIKEKGTDRILGECGFHTWNKTHRRAELFYVMYADSDKRKGYMSEALPIVLQYGFEEMDLHRIQAMIDDNNTPSKRLLEKNNFVLEGIAREDYNVNGKNEDSVCYSLLKHEWNL